MTLNNYGVYYNFDGVGDVLLITFDEKTKPNSVEKRENVAVLRRDDKIVGINFFDLKEVMKIKASGFIPFLDQEVLKVLNNILKNLGFEELVEKKESGFRVAKIVDIDEHPDSDHLHICEVDVGDEEPLQIVCGAANARKDLLCVCALPNTFMPDGKEIIPGKLMGIDSFGMLCSGRELGLSGYENKRGLLELDSKEFTVGQDFFR